MNNDSVKNTELTCECHAEENIFLPCAGGPNCGQITNRVAVKLDEEGVGRIYCLAGIGAHVDGIVEKADKMITTGCGAEAEDVCPASFIETQD